MADAVVMAVAAAVVAVAVAAVVVAAGLLLQVMVAAVKAASVEAGEEVKRIVLTVSKSQGQGVRLLRVAGTVVLAPTSTLRPA